MAKAVPITKAKKPTAQERAKEQKRRIAVIDELGDLQIKLKPMQAREKVLLADVQSWCEEYPAAAPVMFDGLKFTAAVSAKANTRKIGSMLKLFTIWGREKFLSLCKVSLEAIEKDLGPDQQKGLIVEEPASGARKIQTYPRAKAA